MHFTAILHSLPQCFTLSARLEQDVPYLAVISLFFFFPHSTPDLVQTVDRRLGCWGSSFVYFLYVCKTEIGLNLILNLFCNTMLLIIYRKRNRQKLY